MAARGRKAEIAKAGRNHQEGQVSSRRTLRPDNERAYGIFIGDRGARQQRNLDF